jgi:hypothetical protein
MRNCEAEAAWQTGNVKNIRQIYPSNVLYIYFNDEYVMYRTFRMPYIKRFLLVGWD